MMVDLCWLNSVSDLIIVKEAAELRRNRGRVRCIMEGIHVKAWS